MNSFKYLFILIFAFQFTACRQSQVPETVKHDIDSIASKWVPQPAESLCDVGLSVTSDRKVVLKGETNLPDARQELVDYMANSGVAFIDSLVLLPDSSVTQKPWGVVTVSVSNIRGDRSHAAELVTQAITGTPVKILKKRGGWLFIQTPDSYLGWTNDGAITELSEAEFTAWKSFDRVISTVNYGNITDNNGSIVSDLVYGSVVERTGMTGGSYIVKMPDGRTGLIKKNEATDFKTWAEKAQPVASDMIAFARTLLGSPYLWGGTSTKGIDCSGYARIIYFTGGMILTRDASSQYLYGEEVSLENNYGSLAPGDLLFFGRIRNGRKNITHTGMYIGDKEFIHSSGMVKINSLDSTRVNYSEYLRSILLGAKRFIDAPSGKVNERVLQHKWYF